MSDIRLKITEPVSKVLKLGIPGVSGKGINISSATISNNELVFTFEDSSTLSAGQVVFPQSVIVLTTNATVGSTVFENENLIAGSYLIEIDGHGLIPDVMFEDGYDWTTPGQVALVTPLSGGELVVAVTALNSSYDHSHSNISLLNNFRDSGGLLMYNQTTIGVIAEEMKRSIFISTDNPSGGINGDIWFQYEL